jgi:hypothetical protein
VDDADQVDPPGELLEVATRVAPSWLRRCVTDAASNAGIDPVGFELQLDSMVATETERLLDRLRALLASDVDDQRANPLSVFRDATVGPTAILRQVGVPPVRRDRFAHERFPDDDYAIIPATWTDIDPALQEPGIAWGAWKAMTVLARRRRTD